MGSNVIVQRIRAGTSKISATERRARFVEAYLSNGQNSLQAAISAGFSKKTAGSQGSRLLRNVQVLSELGKRRADLANAGLWSREQSVRVLSEVATTAEKAADRIRAVAELNVMHGFNAPQKIEHSGTVTRI